MFDNAFLEEHPQNNIIFYSVINKNNNDDDNENTGITITSL